MDLVFASITPMYPQCYFTYLVLLVCNIVYYRLLSVERYGNLIHVKVPKNSATWEIPPAGIFLAPGYAGKGSGRGCLGASMYIGHSELDSSTFCTIWQ